METKKVALYARVSKTDQMNLNQQSRLIDYAKERNLQYDMYEETESTRKTRPVKAGLLERLRRGEYSAVIVFKLDRYARSSTELLLEVNELINKGVGFISISDNLDFTTASGRLHFNILSAFCEFERSLISQRTKESLLYRKNELHIKLGRPPGSKDKQKRKTRVHFKTGTTERIPIGVAVAKE